jgi:hypothetical protein
MYIVLHPDPSFSLSSQANGGWPAVRPSAASIPIYGNECASPRQYGSGLNLAAMMAQRSQSLLNLQGTGSSRPRSNAGASAAAPIEFLPQQPLRPQPPVSGALDHSLAALASQEDINGSMVG